MQLHSFQHCHINHDSTNGENDLKLGEAANGAGPRTPFAQATATNEYRRAAAERYYQTYVQENANTVIATSTPSPDGASVITSLHNDNLDGWGRYPRPSSLSIMPENPNRPADPWKTYTTFPIAVAAMASAAAAAASPPQPPIAPASPPRLPIAPGDVWTVSHPPAGYP